MHPLLPRLFPARARRHRGLCISCVIALLLTAAAAPLLAQDSLWVRPAKAGDPLTWGRRDGIIFGLPSEGGIRGPRGLIRIALFADGSTEPQLLNFIAIEPVIEGVGRRFDRLAFSELELSELDPGQRGKRLWVHPEKGPDKDAAGGTLTTLHSGKASVERLSVRIDVEKFTANGAHVYLIASIDSDHPKELRLSVFAEKDSPPLEELAVTATMGNYERLRLLWLKDQVVDSRTVFAKYAGDAFVEQESFPLSEMLRSGEGDAIVFCTSNETDPRKSEGNETAHWKYPLPKITQYWRLPGHDIQPDLRARVNARRVYWASTAPVLGGVAFENFEVRQRYVPAQTFIFGITEQEPWLFYQGLTHLKPPVEDNPQTQKADRP